MPQQHLVSSTAPTQNRCSLRQQCPFRAWMRIEACSEEKAPYRRSVCRPGRAWSSFHVSWLGRPLELEKTKSLLRSFSTSRIIPAASRTSLVAGAVSVTFRLVASQTSSSASVLLDMDTGYGYYYAEKIVAPRINSNPPLSSSSKHVPISFSAHFILRQRRLLTRPPIALELAASVLLLNSFCPYTWPFEYHCRLLRLREKN
jgi:hypothetical protein